MVEINPIVLVWLDLIRLLKVINTEFVMEKFGKDW